MDLLIRNGRVATDGNEFDADIAVRGGRIAAVGDLGGIEAAEVVDASGLLVFPGLVDGGVSLLGEGPHCPAIDQPFQLLSSEAIAGGVTTVVIASDLGTDAPWSDARQQRASELDGRAFVDFDFHYAIPDWTPKIRDHFAEAVRNGLASAYACRSPLKGEALVHAALEAAAGSAAVFAQVSDGVVERFQRQRLRAEGRVGAGDYAEVLPPWAEAAAVARLSAMARAADSPLVLLGATCAESLREFAMLRERAAPVTLGAKLMHLAFSTDGMLEESQPTPRFAWPPLRGRGDQQALWDALDEGLVSIATSGHHPLASQDALHGQRDASEAPAGCSGLAHLLPMLHSEGPGKWRTRPGALSLFACADPARLLGLYPRKGTLQPGADADIVLFDPAEEAARPDRGSRQGFHDCFAGEDCIGAIRAVYLRGTRIAGDGAAKEPAGQLLDRQPGPGRS